MQTYVGWTENDAARVASLRTPLQSYFGPHVDDFYAEIKKHPSALQVITGGDKQIASLKQTLLRWLDELFSGRYDREYVDRRWRVGLRHVEIGLDQVYTNAALSRLRSGLLAALAQAWTGPTQELLAVRESLNKLLDLDLAIIEDAYQTEYLRRQATIERLAMIGKVAEATLDGLLILNDAKCIKDANPAPCSVLGVPEHALLNQSLDCETDQVFAYLVKPIGLADLPPAIAIAMRRFSDMQASHQQSAEVCQENAAG